MKKERCPQCAAKGKDTSHDNLIVYPDGGAHCFACGFHIHASKTNQLRKKLEGLAIQRSEINYPPDVETNLPEKATEWLRRYGITGYESSKFGCLWSDYRQLLIFPIKKNNTLIGWVGRYFGKEPRPKWHIEGKIKDDGIELGLSYLPNKPLIVFVEDYISAIKLSRYCCVIPIFGAVITQQHLLRAKNLGANKVVIWLDPDKQKESLIYATLARSLGLEAFPIFSEFDPKEMDDDFIKNSINTRI